MLCNIKKLSQDCTLMYRIFDGPNVVFAPKSNSVSLIQYSIQWALGGLQRWSKHTGCIHCIFVKGQMTFAPEIEYVSRSNSSLFGCLDTLLDLLESMGKNGFNNRYPRVREDRNMFFYFNIEICEGPLGWFLRKWGTITELKPYLQQYFALNLNESAQMLRLGVEQLQALYIHFGVAETVVEVAWLLYLKRAKRRSLVRIVVTSLLLLFLIVVLCDPYS